MNQPTSSCYHSLPEEIGLINPGSSTEDFFNRACHTLEDIDIPDVDYWQDDIDMASPADGTIPPSPDHDNPPFPDYDNHPSLDHDDPPPPFDNSVEGQRGQLPSHQQTSPPLSSTVQHWTVIPEPQLSQQGT